MTEELISFDTAKLAKEKGFKKIFCHYGYKKSGKVTVMPSYYDAPTQSLLQKWLREVHEIEVNPAQNFTKGGIKMQYNISIESYKYNHLGKYIYGNTYEEVLEVGLQEGLKLIK